MPDQPPLDLESALKGLRRDWSFLSPVLQSLEHDVATDCEHLSIRLHFPTIHQAHAMVEPFIDKAADHMAHFCLPRAEIESVYAKRNTLSDFAFHSEITSLNARARALFKKANERANKNGEAGELLLYILTEWVLGAPQIIAKMALKTSSEMPVHGADGIHAKFDAATNSLILYSGEAKVHRSLSKAITSAVLSIKKAADYDKVRHEIELVQRNVHLSGLPEAERNALLSYLDPFDDNFYNKIDVVTCLIGYDFSGYTQAIKCEEKVDEEFRKLALAALNDTGAAFAKALRASGLAASRVELFLMPLPSVKDLRDRFQDRIGWKKIDAGSG